jgi:L-fuculose-phosphate aldolase
MNLQQKVSDGTRKPSSEYRLHGIFYERRKDVGAVVHTHSPFATTIACLNRDLPAVHYTIAYAGSKVACAPYATFGTDQLAENAYLAMENRNAALLANHGLVALGSDIATAFRTALEIEYVAELYYRASSIGEPVIIDDSEMENVLERFKNYGQNSK